MTSQVFAEDLENEIGLMEQELLMKRSLLTECRQKLDAVIAEHKETKTNLTRILNEKKDLQIQLDFSLKATENLELENNKKRDLLVKLQVQTDSYLTERQQLLDRCYNTELENNRLKNEITDLREEIKLHNAFQENCKLRQNQTESLVSEALRKQEIINKELIRLEAVCKEGLNFASKVSEEANYQAQFVLEANSNRIRMEEEMIRLMATLKKQKNLNETIRERQNEVTTYYLTEWKDCQRESDARINELLEENKRLSEQLNLATSQIGLFLTDKNPQINESMMAI